MEAIRFAFHPVRYGFTLALGALYRAAFTARTGCIHYSRDVPEPALPGDDWVKIDTTLGGICGSDLSLITLRDSPSLSPFASFPFVIGHENVGILREVGPGVHRLAPGQRVVADPLLSCETRGFADVCAACGRGAPQQCTRFAGGSLAPGMLIGSCRDTGGSWGETFVAHRTRVYPVPPQVSDENALLAEPFGCALHGVDTVLSGGRLSTRARPTALIIGGGVIGLSTIAAVRLLAPRTRIVVLVRHSFQEEMARRLGADTVLRPVRGMLYEEVADALGARPLKPIFGPPVLVGGADIVYECAGSPRALADSLRFAKPGGHVVLLGLAAVPWGVDWSHVWRKELTVHGVFAAGPVTTGRGPVPSMQYALDLFARGTVDLSPLVTHRFPLHAYRQALAAALNKGGSGCIKAVFEF